MADPDLEIDLLRTFVAVAETGNFTAAAEMVGRSQSAVSQKILRFEEILARRVFNRTSRSIIRVARAWASPPVPLQLHPCGPHEREGSHRRKPDMSRFVFRTVTAASPARR